MNRHPAQMSKLDRLNQLLALKILGVGSRPKFFSRQINGVRARLDCRP